MTVVFLLEMLEQEPPFLTRNKSECSKNWQTICDMFNEKMRLIGGQTRSCSACQQHWEKLSKGYKAGQAHSARASGVIEFHDQRVRLLAHLVELQTDYQKNADRPSLDPPSIRRHDTDIARATGQTASFNAMHSRSERSRYIEENEDDSRPSQDSSFSSHSRKRAKTSINHEVLERLFEHFDTREESREDRRVGREDHYMQRFIDHLFQLLKTPQQADIDQLKMTQLLLIDRLLGLCYGHSADTAS
jgi:hypothetical protein